MYPYIILCFWKVYACFLCFTTRCLQYPDWLVLFSESEGWKQIIKQIPGINLPKPNSLNTCDVSSAVHIHVIRNTLEARQATALHAEKL